MTKQSIANKKQRIKSRKAVEEITKDYGNKIIYNSCNAKCVYCHKDFTLALSHKNGLEMSVYDWLAFYEKRPFLGVIVQTVFSDGMAEQWHGLCHFRNDIKMGYDKL